jgi:hypothetical protein
MWIGVKCKPISQSLRSKRLVYWHSNASTLMHTTATLPATTPHRHTTPARHNPPSLWRRAAATWLPLPTPINYPGGVSARRSGSRIGAPRSYSPLSTTRHPFPRRCRGARMPSSPFSRRLYIQTLPLLLIDVATGPSPPNDEPPTVLHTDTTNPA